LTAASAARTAIVTNGVDFNYWQPAAHAAAPRTLVFVGQLDYFPNVDGALWFARDVLPLIRATMGDVRFVIVGRNPVPELQRLAKETDGVQLVASPPDVRPFLAGACAAVAPIRLARGLQNKVLEALAMGKRVYASREVCQTFGGALPEGVVECGDARMFAAQVSQTLPEQGFTDERIRSALRAGYSWDAAGEALAEIVRQVARA